MNRTILGLAALLAGFAGAALAGPPEVKLVSVRLEPENPAIWGAKATQRFLVIGKYSDGLERDITKESRFTVSDSRIASVDEAGRVTALADGRVVLKAEAAGGSVRTAVEVTGSSQDRPFSFARDMGGLFTRQGCNDSSCHGGVRGKGGLKLSINALYPEDDYKWIVEGGTYHVLTTETGEKIPRINLKEPEKSLLLQKPTMQIAHGGGPRFPEGSTEYETILNWVRAGAPYGEKAGDESVRVERIEVFPKQSVIDIQGRHGLLVTAHLSNGQREDITDKVLYQSNNEEVAKVDSSGMIAAVRAGETSVLIRAAGFAVSAGIGVIGKPVPNYPEVPRANFVDELVFAKLRKFNIVPSELSSDSEFVRRVCLDLTGTLPPPERVREFLADRDPLKRVKLIDTLLKTPEYVDYWTFRFADLYRVATFQNGINERWGESYWNWIRDNIKQNTPYDQIARERIAAVGDSPATAHFKPNGDVREPQNKMAEQIRVFLGRRLDCAQCHNHPFESWSQDQFWGLTAFFGRMNVINGRGEETGTVIYEDPTGQEVDLFDVDKSRKVLNPRTKEEVPPRFLSGAVVPENERGDLRVKLADWVVSHPYFAEATVNRMWSYFFGRGLVNPVDDFRSTNPATHPELLKGLADDFREHGYDLQHLMRAITNSRTYQLSAQSNETNQDDETNYSRSLSRALDAEVLFDSIAWVAGVPPISFRATRGGGVLPPGTRAINVKMPDLFESRVLGLYGTTYRTMVPERRTKPNLGQALHRLAGKTFTGDIERGDGRIDQLIGRGASDRQIIEELYLLALSRMPLAEETKELEALIQGRPSRKEALQDLLWGVVGSEEFSTNH